MTERRLHTRGMTWVMLTLAIAMIPQLASMPAHLVPLTIMPLAWRAVTELKRWKPLPMLVRLSVTFATVGALVVTYGGLMGRRAAVSLLTLMLSLKLLETFKVRDARVVASLSLFLCATQFLFAQGVVMLLYGLACIVSALLALTFLAREEAWAPLREGPAEGMSVLSELGFSARLLAIAVPAAAMLFLLFPRWGSPLWGVPEEALDARTGLSDSMEPGSIQGLFMDDTPAFRVEFSGPVPPPSSLYWRGPVFWNFDGRRWEPGFYGRSAAAPDRPSVAEAPYRYEVQLEPTERRSLFAMDYPAVVPRGAKLTLDYQLLTRRPVTQLRSYTMASNPDFVDAPQLYDTLRRLALQLPEGYNPRTRALIADWRARFPDDAALVRHALSHFRTEAFRYTLNPPLLSRHSVDEFLFETRAGFCEHYASAFTLMMRMAGIPSRVVTGYQGGWYNQGAGYLLVRQSDAHAWSEVWIEGSGWTRIDPTAAVSPQRIENGALDALSGRRHWYDYEWLRSMRNALDLVQRGWNDWVIAFNAERQLRLLEIFGRGQAGPRTLVFAMVVALALVSLAVTPWLLRLRRREARDPASRAWRRFVRKLKGAGYAPAPSLGAFEVAEACVERGIGRPEAVRRIARLYSDCRYAASPPDVAELRGAVRAFRPQRA